MSAALDVPVYGGKGARGLMATATKGLAALAPDLIRERLCEPEFTEHFLASLEAGVRQCDRTCMRLYAEALKLVGQQINLAVAITAEIGVSVPVARGAVESMERAKGMTVRQRLEMHARALREAGWDVTPPADWSEVEVMQNDPQFTTDNGAANKHANGNGGPHL